MTFVLRFGTGELNGGTAQPVEVIILQRGEGSKETFDNEIGRGFDVDKGATRRNNGECHPNFVIPPPPLPLSEGRPSYAVGPGKIR